MKNISKFLVLIFTLSLCACAGTFVKPDVSDGSVAAQLMDHR